MCAHGDKSPPPPVMIPKTKILSKMTTSQAARIAIQLDSISDLIGTGEKKSEQKKKSLHRSTAVQWESNYN